VKRIAALCLLSFFAPSTFSKTPSGLLSVGLDFGGDKLATFTYGDSQEKSFRAASLTSVTAGMWHSNPLGHNDLSTRAALGFKAAGLSASNASLDFYRWFIELSEFYAFPESRFQLGAGLGYHFYNRLRGSGEASSYSASIKPSWAFFAQGEYFITRKESLLLGVRHALMGLRITTQSYQSHNNPAREIDATGLGLHLSLLW
jgi:hypothetical protein